MVGWQSGYPDPGFSPCGEHAGETAILSEDEVGELNRILREASDWWLAIRKDRGAVAMLHRQSVSLDVEQ
jgi:hypothetical protein